jgi:transaldolase
VAHQTYKAYRDLLNSDRWQRLASLGARPQRLLFASTSTKDPKASDTLYVEALAAPDTVNTMPDETLLAFADHGKLDGPLAPDGGDSKDVLDAYEKAGIGVAALASKLQSDGAASFVASWKDLLSSIKSKTAELV